jgi:hypothetical protein
VASTDFLTEIVNGFVDLLEPFTDALQSVDGLGALVAEFGWAFDDSQSESSYTQPFTGVQSAITGIQSFVASGDDSFLTAVGALVTALRDLSSLPSGSSSHSWPNFVPFSDSEFQQTFARELLDYLVYEYFKSELPRLFGAFSLLNIFSTTQVPADPHRAAYELRYVDWNGMLSTVSNPSGVFSSNGPFGWGSSSLNSAKLIQAIYGGLHAFGLPVFVQEPETAIATTYYGSTNQALAEQVVEVLVPLYSSVDSTSLTVDTLSIALGAMPIPPTNSQTAPPDGIVVFLDASGNFQTSIPITDWMTASLTGEFTSTGGIRVDLHPGSANVTSAVPGTTLGSTFTLTVANPDGSPFVLLGSSDSDCVELSSAQLIIGVSANTSATGNSSPSEEFTIQLQANQLSVSLDFSESDGFLQSLLGSAPQTIQGSFGIQWSSVHGFTFNGQAQLSATIALHLSLLGVLDIDTITVAVMFADASGSPPSLGLDIGITGGVNIGPISATIQNMGIAFSLTGFETSLPANGVGLPDLDFGFKPPDGLGLSIDAPPVSGGGFIAYGQDQYAGWAELSIDILNLRVFGLLDTQPVSFLLIVQAGFPPIQLGFGFTLNDVGGLVGVDRTMSLDALQSALMSGSLDSTLFLDDPVSQAAQMIATVSNMFPAQQGHYVFGPMCKIGWGTPTLIEAELGFLIEFPDPVRIAIVGGISCALPAEQAALILINLESLGTIDFGIGLLTIDASLYGSRIVVYSLSGDMSFRLSWGNPPGFALSIGGFNPKYQPPPAFPSPMTRMTVSIGVGNNPYLGCSGYLAVTSNSLQFGAEVDLYMAAGSFSVSGQVGFDALFIVSPSFSFIIDLYANVEILNGSTSLFSVYLSLMLSGPAPWNAHGTASFNILFFSVSIDANITWGSASGNSFPPASDTIGPLTQGLSALNSWQSILPSGVDVVGSFVAYPPDPSNPAATILLHPMGQLQVSQTVIPLGIQIQKFGNGTPANADYFDVGAVESNQTESLTVVTAEFAVGQFFNLTDDQKISDPSYLPYTSGGSFGSTASSSDPSAGLSQIVAYDNFVVDDPLAPAYQPPAPPNSEIEADPLVQSSFVVAGPVGTRASGRARYAATPLKEFIAVASPKYLVVSTTDLSINTGLVPASGTSEQDATNLLNEYVDTYPDKVGRFQVMPVWEVPTS